MASPKRWTIAGLLLIATSSLTIVDIVWEFRAHGREDSQILDCASSFKDQSISDVPAFFACMVMTKISIVLMQLGMAADCFITADRRLGGSNTREFLLVAVSLGLYYIASFALTILVEATWTNTDCFSCCLAHERVRVYLLWSIPSLLLMALSALALLIAFLFGLYFVLKRFLRVLVVSFIYEPVSTDVSKDVEVV